MQMGSLDALELIQDQACVRLRLEPGRAELDCLAADARVVEFEGASGILRRIEFDREPYDAPAEAGTVAHKLLRVRSSWRPGASLSVPAERVGTLPQHAAELADAPAGAGAPSSTP